MFYYVYALQYVRIIIICVIATEKKYINSKFIQNRVKSNVRKVVLGYCIYYALRMWRCFRLRRSWHEPDLERRGPDLERRASEDTSYGKTLTVRDEYDTRMPLPEETGSDTESTVAPTLTIPSPTNADNISESGQ